MMENIISLSDWYISMLRLHLSSTSTSHRWTSQVPGRAASTLIQPDMSGVLTLEWPLQESRASKVDKKIPVVGLRFLVLAAPNIRGGCIRY